MSSSRRQYPFHLIEPKWQKFWESQQTFRAWNPGEKIPSRHPFALRHGADCMCEPGRRPRKCYILDMFPYPSGAGLHVGHPEGYTATDILARYMRARGFHVLHPMGWDAFGLPAEQFAVKTGRHPRQTTAENIATFKRQIQSLGLSYDWSREVDTTDPAYFKWTQWIFLQLYNSWFNPKTNRAEPITMLPAPPDEGAALSDAEREARLRAWRDSKRLAYVTEAPVWWCEQLGTVLANEEVVDGRSHVGGFPVVRRPMRQWMLRITACAGRLLEDLNLVDWSHSLKEMQRNWIGRSEGAEVDFQVAGSPEKIRVFTTRPDTLFGATYIVLAPEHRLVDSITPPAPRVAVARYKADVAKKSDLERTELAREKSGVFTGAYALNPVNGQRIPIWIADYVLATYGTGAIMAVPAHDTRDFEFAKKFDLPVIQVVQPPDADADWRGYTGDGASIHSTGPQVSITGLPTQDAKEKITAWLESKNLGRRAVHYKLRDWLFSRQRYWGEPFPIVWKRDARGGVCHEALPEAALPVLPPELDDYKPTPDGRPPLARAANWVNLPDGSQRETNTMPQWAGSCWYYLRFLNPQNAAAFVDKEAETYWMGPRDAKTPCPAGVDLYVGGAEHAVLHLLYARFWHKVLYDLGHVSTPEPFLKLVNQGMVLGEDNQKMSKSRGNVIAVDAPVREVGTDAFRLYEMFMGPLEMVKPWSTAGVEGVYRFLGRVWRLFVDETSETQFEQAATVARPEDQAGLLDMITLDSAIQDVAPGPPQLKALHGCIRKVTEDIEALRFNTAISALMVFVNEAMTWKTKPVSAMRDFLILLQPFAPHLAGELWSKLQRFTAKTRESAAGMASLSYQPWPVFDPALLVEAEIEVPVQVNGKLRDVVKVPVEAGNAALEAAATASEKVRQFTDGKTIKKIIVVPKKLVNIVAV